VFAFTGAQQSKAGHIELASAGGRFLDEVSEMSPMAQAKREDLFFWKISAIEGNLGGLRRGGLAS